MLLLGLIYCLNKSLEYKDLYNKELQNVEAYRAANSGLEGEILEYKMSINELYASKDSLDKKLLSVMQELKISEKEIQSLQYQLNNISRTDTIKVSDTIFIPNVNIDTLIGDYWYNIRLQLQYPSTVITTPTFNSEQYIYIYNEKKYVGGKSKCFFINWFKKTYISTEVKVEEKNPNIKLLNQKFIKVDTND
jgi:hypothetical protein